MNERDFLALARLLAGMTTEVAWRSAVSRAYYSAFHVARRLLEGLGFAVPQAETAHKYLCYRLENSGNARVQHAGTNLNDLRRARNRADYELGRAVGQGLARGQVNLAEHVIQALDAAAAEPTRSAITAEMARYERDVLKDVTWRP